VVCFVITWQIRVCFLHAGATKP